MDFSLLHWYSDYTNEYNDLIGVYSVIDNPRKVIHINLDTEEIVHEEFI